MKEAAGEANLTVVAIILIAVVVAVATPLVSGLMKNSAKRSCCTDAGGVWKSNKCVNAPNATESNKLDKDSYKTCCTDAGADCSNN